MRYFEEMGYRFTAHGQTPDLYEDMYGEDSDLLADLLDYCKGQREMLKNLDKTTLEKIEQLSKIDPEKISINEYKKYEKVTDKINLRGHRKMRQIILCLLMQTEVDKGNEPTILKLQQGLDPAIYTNPKIIQKTVDLLTGGTKEKKTGQTVR